MRWSSHKISTFCIVLAVSSDVLLTIIATAGSIFPDAIEFVFQPSVPKKSNRPKPIWKHHRKASHWPYTYLSVSFGLVYAWYLTSNLVYLLIGMFFIGASLHLLEDICSISGIPLTFKLSKSYGFGFYKTGKISELICVVCIVLLSSLYVFLAEPSFAEWIHTISVHTMQNAYKIPFLNTLLQQGFL